MLVTINQGKAIKVEGDQEHPFTKGFLCQKLRTYHQRVHSDQRILWPLRRTGKKGEGKFKRISWDEAWDQIVTTFKAIEKEHGSEALLPYSYAGNMGLINRNAGDPFFHRFCASRLDRTICSSAARAGWTAHYGTGPNDNPEKAVDATLIVAWGINIKVTNIHFWPLIQQARRKGAKLVVIDPYQNITAKAADHYIALQPGGDSALALGILKVILKMGWEDNSFIKECSTGFKALQDYVSSISLEQVSEQSGVSQEEIQNLAGMFSENPKTFIRIGIGLSRNSRGANSIRAITSLAAALGLFDGGKGRGALLSSSAFSGDHEKLVYQQHSSQPTRLINMAQLGDALTTLSPPIKSLFVYNSNPLSVAPDTGKVRAGLEREDLFTVVHEQVMTPTAGYADLILPATTSFENKDLYTGYGHFIFSQSNPVLPPQGEAISNFDLFQRLARKMGYTNPAFSQTLEERIEDYLENFDGLPEGVKVSSLSDGRYIRSKYADLKESFFGDGKKFQFKILTPNSSDQGIPQLLKAKEFDHPGLIRAFPFKLITPPLGKMLNSTFGENHSIESGTVMIHPVDSKKLAILDGEVVEISNDRGQTLRKAKITKRTQKGLLVAEGIYWADEFKGEQGINHLTSQNLTDLGGGPVFHESRVKVRKLEIQRKLN